MPPKITIEKPGDMYTAELRDEFGSVQSAAVAETIEEIAKWVVEHGKDIEETTD